MFDPKTPTGTPDFLILLDKRALNNGISFFKSKLTNNNKSASANLLFISVAL